MLKSNISQEEIDNLPYYKRVKLYKCSNCNREFGEIVKKASKSKDRVKCPECNKNALEAIVEVCMGFVSQEPKTVAQLADRNTKKMGKYELETKRIKEKNKYKKELEEYHNPQNDSVFDSEKKKRKVMNLSGHDKERYLKGEIDV